jgi:hypothetical protein
MRYGLFSDIGGFIYWLVFKFCKSDLQIELSKNNWARNIFITLITIFIITFLSVKFQQ